MSEVTGNFINRFKVLKKAGFTFNDDLRQELKK